MAETGAFGESGDTSIPIQGSRSFQESEAHDRKGVNPCEIPPGQSDTIDSGVNAQPEDPQFNIISKTITSSDFLAYVSNPAYVFFGGPPPPDTANFYIAYPNPSTPPAPTLASFAAADIVNLTPGPGNTGLTYYVDSQLTIDYVIQTNQLYVGGVYYGVTWQDVAGALPGSEFVTITAPNDPFGSPCSATGVFEVYLVSQDGTSIVRADVTGGFIGGVFQKWFDSRAIFATSPPTSGGVGTPFYVRCHMNVVFQSFPAHASPWYHNVPEPFGPNNENDPLYSYAKYGFEIAATRSCP